MVCVFTDLSSLFRRFGAASPTGWFVASPKLIALGAFFGADRQLLVC